MMYSHTNTKTVLLRINSTVRLNKFENFEELKEKFNVLLSVSLVHEVLLFENVVQR